MREIRSSGSAEGVIGNCDPYSDSPEAMVVKQPKFTRVGEPAFYAITRVLYANFLR